MKAKKTVVTKNTDKDIVFEGAIKTEPKKVIKESTPKWNLSQDDYIELLKSVEINAQAIVNLQNEVNRLKGRMGLGSGI